MGDKPQIVATVIQAVSIDMVDKNTIWSVKNKAVQKDNPPFAFFSGGVCPSVNRIDLSMRPPFFGKNARRVDGVNGCKKPAG